MPWALGKQLWLFHTSQKWCKRYLLVYYYCQSSLIGVEMPIPGFLGLLRYFDCFLVTSLILTHCSALWFVQLTAFQHLLALLLDLLRVQIKVHPSESATFWDFLTCWYWLWQDIDRQPHHCSSPNGAWLLVAPLFSRWNSITAAHSYHYAVIVWLYGLVLLGGYGKVVSVGVCSH